MSNFHGNDRACWAAAGVNVCESAYEPGRCLRRHDHEHAFWCLTLRGGYTEHVGRRRRQAGPGHLAWHPPGEHHHLKFAHVDTVAVNVELRGEWLARLNEIGFDPDQPRDLGAHGARLVRELMSELRREDGDTAWMAGSLIGELLAETAGFGEAVPWRDTPSWLLEVRDYIHAHHARTVRLDEIAQAVNIHPVHLARRYRQFSGRPVGAHLRQLRVDAARRLLRDTDRPLADIALECGFADQPHFCRVFRRLVGTTPAAYRAAR